MVFYINNEYMKIKKKQIKNVDGNVLTGGQPSVWWFVSTLDIPLLFAA